jgi:hypothetical protein
MPMQPRTEERFAFEILRRVTGAEVRLLDNGTRPGMVDGYWELPGGCRAVVEVRLLIEPQTAEVNSRLGEHDHRLPVEGLKHHWEVYVGPQVRVRDLRRDLPQLLLWCQTRDLDGFEELRWTRRGQVPFLEHPIRTGELSAHQFTGVPSLGYVRLLPPAIGGAAGDGGIVTGWLSRLLASRGLAGHVAKLAAAHAEERHLWLGVHMSGAPFAAFYALTDETVVPQTDPVVPAHLDAVWLFAQFSAPVLVWRRGEGWSRHPWEDGVEAPPPGW